MKSILDRDFKYTPAAQTSADYLRERFNQIRQEIEQKKKQEESTVRRIFRIRSA